MAGVLLVLFVGWMVVGVAFARTSSFAIRSAWACSGVALGLLAIATDMAWRVSHGIPSGFHRHWGDQGFPVYDSPGQGAALAVADFVLGLVFVCMALRQLRRARTDAVHPPRGGEVRWFEVAWVTVATWVVVRASYIVGMMMRGEPVPWYGSVAPGDDSVWQALAQLATCLAVAGFFYYVAVQVLGRVLHPRR